LRHADRSVVALDGLAIRGYELTVRIHLEMALACIAVAIGRAHHEEAVAMESDIERIAVRSQGAFAPIARHGRSFHIGKFGPVLWGVQIFLEPDRLRLEGRRGDVREVVRDHVHLSVQGRLARERYITGIFHRQPGSLETWLRSLRRNRYGGPVARRTM